VSEEEVNAALREARWDRTAAAAILRMSKTSLYEMLEKIPRFRTARDLTIDEISRAWEDCNGDVERMVDRLEVSERALRQRLRDMGLERR
jgi:two-component system nitrogen regulation response regulator GlnG